MNIALTNITERPASYISPIDDANPNIVRLVEDPEIKKSIRFDEMNIPGIPDPESPNGGNHKLDELGLVYPIIRINDVILARKNIRSLVISTNGFVPTISLSLVFDDTSFASKNMPKDGDMISIFIRVDTAAIAYLRDDFIITRCNISNNSRGSMGSYIDLSGKLFVPALDSKSQMKSITGTSKYVFKQLAQSYGLGFSFNDYDDTDDFMNWIQCRETTQSFVASVLRHAWKDETSFFNAWIDLYYNLCFVNVNKFLLSTENEEDIDITFATNILNIYNQLKVDTSIGSVQMTAKLLTTFYEFRNTPFFIRRWRPSNSSSMISFRTGYSTSSFTFKHNQYLMNKGDYDSFEELTNIPAYDQNKTDSHILLRGRTTYDAGENPTDEQARVNYDYIGTYTTAEWTGVEYTMSENDKNKGSNQWSGNVHKNYNRAPYHNSQNFSEIGKIYLDVECEGLTLQIMKGERIPVLIGFTNSIENDMYNAATKDDMPSIINRFYSGYYIVDSITYSYEPISGRRVSPYTTRFILKRREWPTPEAIIKDNTNE